MKNQYFHVNSLIEHKYQYVYFNNGPYGKVRNHLSFMCNDVISNSCIYVN